MSVAAHFDTLEGYKAAAVRIEPTDGEPEDALGEGGGLAASFERRGQRVLVEVLRDPAVAAITLADGDLVVELRRSGGGARLVVRWGEDVIVDDAVEIPPPAPLGAGPWFRPDRTSRVGHRSVSDPRDTLFVVRDESGELGWFTRGVHGPGVGQHELVATLPAIDPASLGAASFLRAHGVRWAYVGGDMAGGISSVEMVSALAAAGLLGFFGAGGLPVEAVERALVRLRDEVPAAGYGFNLLHNPGEPGVEDHTVDLYLKYGVRRVSASAFMGLTPAVVRYRAAGLVEAPDGSVERRHHVFAKLSRSEVAEKFLRPPPAEVLRELVGRGAITEVQARLAATVPVAEDITAEGDSGGHTDHRPLVVMLPVMLQLRDRISAELGYSADIRPRIGAAGGLGSPNAVWGAFAMGADYVLTGSVNQASPEAGTSAVAKVMLSEASFTDVGSGPAPDMFEIGAKVQVLSRGSLYTQRAQKLYDLYRAWPSIEEIPTAERERIEKQIFRRSLDDVWAETAAYWSARDPRMVDRANAEPRHRMALCFRWYLGMTSRWARVGDEDRKRDFQVWCGPAMGGFNDWVRGSALEPIERRGVVAIAEVLMWGAAASARVAQARLLGLPLPPDAASLRPKE